MRHDSIDLFKLKLKADMAAEGSLSGVLATINAIIDGTNVGKEMKGETANDAISSGYNKARVLLGI